MIATAHPLDRDVDILNNNLTVTMGHLDHTLLNLQTRQ